MVAQKPYLLGIDIGGTGTKAGVFSIDGTLAGSGYGEYQMISTVPGQAEHDAEGWWQATVRAIRDAIKDIDPAAIKAIGIGCTNGLIAVDGLGQPIRPAIMLWDQRALPEVERIKEQLGAETVFDITGNPLAPGAFSLPTILWLMHNEPDSYQAAHKLMVPGGYLVARLTGEFTIDHSRASTTLLFDIRRRQWHQPFLEKLRIDPDKLPRPVACDEIVGSVTGAAAELTGLTPGTPVIGGCMDTIGASLGTGVLEEGQCFVIMGTAARVAGPLTTGTFDRRFMNCTHITDNCWQYIGAINGVGSALRWVRDTFCQMELAEAQSNNTDVYHLITAQAQYAPPGSKGLLFLPYLAGERTPIWDPYARGVFFGVTLGHNRGDFFRSVLEGAAFAIRHVIELLESDSRLEIKELRIGGAAASSAVWNQIIADVLGKRVISLTQSHTEVLGAALLAGVGLGLYPSYPEAISRTVVTGGTFEPDLEAHKNYNKLFPMFKQLYEDTKHHFRLLVEMDLPQGWVTKGFKQ
jgi:xylulokinase